MFNTFNFSNKIIDTLTIVFLTTTIVFSPFYIFNSGMAQPSHYIMAFCATALLITKGNEFIHLVRKQIISIFFILLICSINLIYGLNSHALNFFINTAYWIYGFIILFSVILIANETKYYKITKFLIAISFILIITLYFLGFGGYVYAPRYNGFFNSPNQIGYYSLLMMIVFFTTNNKKFDKLFFFVYALALFTIYISGSRSVYLAIISLVFVFLIIPNINFKQITLLLLLPFIVLFLTKIPTLEKKNYPLAYNSGLNINNIAIATDTISRFQDLSNMGVIRYQLEGRGYDRFYKYPHFLIYGAGQGNDNRFMTEFMSTMTHGHNYEIHSSLFAVLFYYGFVGLILFLKTIYNFFLFKKNIVFLLPIFTYGLFTYGLRTPYFWFALGFLIVMSDTFKSTNKINDIIKK
tara:strand:- start:1509 stop:2732 length:1224 start_codon:yes stop_codon:yes gene_type:complete